MEKTMSIEGFIVLLVGGFVGYVCPPLGLFLGLVFVMAMFAE
jgi:hypothetical protein